MITQHEYTSHDHGLGSCVVSRNKHGRELQVAWRRIRTQQLKLAVDVHTRQHYLQYHTGS